MKAGVLKASTPPDALPERLEVRQLCTGITTGDDEVVFFILFDAFKDIDGSASEMDNLRAGL